MGATTTPQANVEKDEILERTVKDLGTSLALFSMKRDGNTRFKWKLVGKECESQMKRTAPF